MGKHNPGPGKVPASIIVKTITRKDVPKSGGTHKK